MKASGAARRVRSELAGSSDPELRAFWLAQAPAEPVVHERADDLTRLGPGEVIALAEVATELAQRLELPAGLDAFGRHREAERVREGDDGLDDRRVLGVLAEAVNERLVDFQDVDGKQLEVAERRLARAEVVDADVHAHL